MSNEKRVIATSLAQLKGMAEGATKNGTTFTQKLKALNNEIAKKKADIAAQIELAGPDRKAKAEAHYNAEFDDWIRDYRKATETERYATLKELNAANEQVAYARKNLTDSRNLCTAWALGEERRSRLEASLASMGGASLAALAAKAQAESDKELCAAICAVNDSIPRNERSFNSSELAEAVFGPDAAQAREYVTTIDRSLAASMIQNREFDGHKVSAFAKLQSGLKYDGKLVPTEKPNSGPPRKTSVELISEGLAEL